MAVYTVHEPPPRGAAAPEPERFVFVRDGFSFWALVFGPLWMLRHRMWLVLLGYVLLVTLLGWALRQANAPIAVGFLINTLLSLLIALEASTLRRFTLARMGFTNVGIVVGDDLDLAERRFFDAWIKKSGRSGAAASGLPPKLRMPDAPSPVLGLFPEPGASS
jgi:hypothetical protein